MQHLLSKYRRTLQDVVLWKEIPESEDRQYDRAVGKTQFWRKHVQSDETHRHHKYLREKRLKNDGSVQFIVRKGDEVVMNQKMENNKEVEFKNPDGVLIKSLSKIEGDDVVKTTLTFPNGRQVEIHRYFEGNSMRMEVIVPDFDKKGVVYYEAV